MLSLECIYLAEEQWRCQGKARGTMEIEFLELLLNSVPTMLLCSQRLCSCQAMAIQWGFISVRVAPGIQWGKYWSEVQQRGGSAVDRPTVLRGSWSSPWSSRCATISRSVSLPSPLPIPWFLHRMQSYAEVIGMKTNAVNAGKCLYHFLSSDSGWKPVDE